MNKKEDQEQLDEMEGYKRMDGRKEQEGTQNSWIKWKNKKG